MCILILSKNFEILIKKEKLLKILHEMMLDKSYFKTII